MRFDPTKRRATLPSPGAREKGKVKIIDLLRARLDAKADAYKAELPSLQLNDIHISDQLVNEHDRMLTGGFYAEIDLRYDAIIAEEKNGRPFSVAGLRPIQLSKRDVLNALYGLPVPDSDSGTPGIQRDDLVQVFLTGVPGLNKPPGVVASEQLRLNMGTPLCGQGSAPDCSTVGVLGGDPQGYPNGRRLTDDLVAFGVTTVSGLAAGIDGAAHRKTLDGEGWTVAALGHGSFPGRP